MASFTNASFTVDSKYQSGTITLEGDLNGSDTESIFQWYRSIAGTEPLKFASIPGATSRIYRPSFDDVDCILRVEVLPIAEGGSSGELVVIDSDGAVSLDPVVEMQLRLLLANKGASIPVEVNSNSVTLSITTEGIAVDGGEMLKFSPDFQMLVPACNGETAPVFTAFSSGGSSLEAIKCPSRLMRDVIIGAIRSLNAAVVIKSLTQVGARTRYTTLSTQKQVSTVLRAAVFANADAEDEDDEAAEADAGEGGDKGSLGKKAKALAGNLKGKLFGKKKKKQEEETADAEEETLPYIVNLKAGSHLGPLRLMGAPEGSEIQWQTKTSSGAVVQLENATGDVYTPKLSSVGTWMGCTIGGGSDVWMEEPLTVDAGLMDCVKLALHSEYHAVPVRDLNDIAMALIFKRNALEICSISEKGAFKTLQTHAYHPLMRVEEQDGNEGRFLLILGNGEEEAFNAPSRVDRDYISLLTSSFVASEMADLGEAFTLMKKGSMLRAAGN